MEFLIFLVVWPLLGVASFFLARAVWQKLNGQAPFTLDSLIKLLILMWFPPLSLLAAIVWWTTRNDAKAAETFDKPPHKSSDGGKAA